MPLGLEGHSQPTPTISMNMVNVPHPCGRDTTHEMSVQRQPNKTVLAQESVSTPVIIGLYVPDRQPRTASTNQPGLYTPSGVFAENPPSRYPKAFVSIDFGATYSGLSYAISSPGEVRQILAWPGSTHSFSKIPTCLVYDALGDIRAWGLEATDMRLKKGWVRCEWFKLWLDPSSAPSTILESRFFQPPKNVVDLVADYLSCLWTHAKNQIHRENGSCSLSHAEVYLTVPSSWDLRASLFLREAAIKASDFTLFRMRLLRPQIRCSCTNILELIGETEVSVIHPVNSPAFKCQRESFTICDAGGATIDLATYNVMRGLGAPNIVEAAPRSGSYCGALFLDLRFRELVQERLATHPVHLDEESLAHFVRSFSRSEKLDYQGTGDDTKLFRFRCLHAEDLDDPAVGFDHGELVIPGGVLRRKVFDPVVEQVLHSIATHVQAPEVRLDVLFLVGGFSTNEYLFQRITEQFGSSIVSVIRPGDGDIGSCHGGPRFGISSLVSSVKHTQNVFRRVALPAEREDRMMRPVYITSVPGRSLCEHRVEYIVRRGASIVKGDRSELRLRKLCSSRYDRTFELVLYSSNDEQTSRYFDQEEGEELCRCQIDLGTYPSFQEQVEASPFGNFYVDFVLGFEMGSAVTGSASIRAVGPSALTSVLVRLQLSPCGEYDQLINISSAFSSSSSFRSSYDFLRIFARTVGAGDMETLLGATEGNQILYHRAEKEAVLLKTMRWILGEIGYAVSQVRLRNNSLFQDSAIRYRQRPE
ncbi:hypothetical protein BS47DRAFT_1396083 [Hydnum rufescens UP504]|uniref:Actin-like ATPase domain-containing protein n=1 Tax=Hydnum rufescens UP504 TaxID=1448309 RepID=A0A9P6ARH8_9AGAM|nr:hypothetical protein BS47DRAFT_1396083 [Hydnum rufescens UP504]